MLPISRTARASHAIRRRVNHSTMTQVPSEIFSSSGFTGVGGFAMSKLLNNVRRKMLTQGMPPVLAAYRATHPA